MELEVAFRYYMRELVSALRTASLNEEPRHFEREYFERGDDGHFRWAVQSREVYWHLCRPGFLERVVGYAELVRAFEEDVRSRDLVDALVGTEKGGSRVDAGDHISDVLHDMCWRVGRLEYEFDAFNAALQRWLANLSVTEFNESSIVLLPALELPDFPLILGAGLSLDRLSAEEVHRFHSLGWFADGQRSPPFVPASNAVGLRRTRAIPRRTWRDGEGGPEPGDSVGPGSFSQRPWWRMDLLEEDALIALRLAKHSGLRSAGTALWVDSPWRSSGTSYRRRDGWPQSFGACFTASEAKLLQNLWKLLQATPSYLLYAARRFSSSYDRIDPADRIVDLAIALEALFAGEARGEVTYRTALNGAKFIEHAHWNPVEVRNLITRAYAVRSKVVHGEELRSKDLRLPDGSKPSAHEFADVIADVVRSALLKAIALKDSHRLREDDFWARLHLGQT